MVAAKAAEFVFAPDVEDSGGGDNGGRVTSRTAGDEGSVGQWYECGDTEGLLAGAEGVLITETPLE